jgi:hypothetical protein
MTIQLKALQSFSGPHGKHVKGATFEASAEGAAALLAGGYAERASVSRETTPVAAVKPPAASRSKRRSK